MSMNLGPLNLVPLNCVLLNFDCLRLGSKPVGIAPPHPLRRNTPQI
jgi:hypothetical protein